MIRFLDTSPDTAVQPAEYQRLLGYPRNRELDERAQALAERARAWYAAHGRPWVSARQASSVDLVGDDGVVIDGVRFNSPRLHRTLADAGADSAVLVAVSAGPELEREAQRLWKAEKPDEYFFLEVFGSAVVEHLAMVTGARLCAEADEAGMAVLPHYSPGYPGWEITEQRQLLELIRSRTDGHTDTRQHGHTDTRKHARAVTPERPGAAMHESADAGLPGPMEVLDSGMLRPKKSLLAVFGLTRQTDRVRPLAELVPCESCSLPACRYRRAPYRRPRLPSEVERMTGLLLTEPELAPEPETHPITLDAKYTTNLKALRRWSQERLKLVQEPDGSVDALFRYEGSTCSNMGRAFCFHYAVKLGPRSDGYPVLRQTCAPAPGDEGHTFMCRYRTSGRKLLHTIARDHPLVGRRIDEVLSWHRAATGPTCYCESEGRNHKWGLVLETIHYALARLEKELGHTTLGAEAP